MNFPFCFLAVLHSFAALPILSCYASVFFVFRFPFIVICIYLYVCMYKVLGSVEQQKSKIKMDYVISARHAVSVAFSVSGSPLVAWPGPIDAAASQSPTILHLQRALFN